MRTLLLASLVAAGLLAAGCGGSEESDRAAATVEDLDGRAFTATAAQGFELDGQVPLTISFDGDTLSVDAGCNSIGGGYEIEEGELRGTELASTLMGCPPPLGEIETATTGMLSDGATATLEGDTLTLVGADGTRLTLQR